MTKSGPISPSWDCHIGFEKRKVVFLPEVGGLHVGSNHVSLRNKAREQQAEMSARERTLMHSVNPWMRPQKKSSPEKTTEREKHNKAIQARLTPKTWDFDNINS